MKYSDIVATIGVSLLLIAFLLQTLKVFKTSNKYYILLNLLGAGIAGYSAWLVSFFPFVILEGVWFIVALFSLIVNFKNIVSRGTQE